MNRKPEKDDTDLFVASIVFLIFLILLMMILFFILGKCLYDKHQGVEVLEDIKKQETADSESVDLSQLDGKDETVIKQDLEI